jgi:hypothetical protein
VGSDDRSSRRIGSKALSVRPAAYAARVAPLQAIAEVVSPRAHSATDHRVSIRVEVISAQPAATLAAAPVLSLLPSGTGFRDSEAVQLMAASTEAALSQNRAALAYATAARIFEATAITRGVCVHVRA